MIEIRYLRAATVLIRWDGLTLLTDPWFARRMRGLPVFVRPCLTPAELPALDLVLVSHLHPAHFARRALSRLAAPCKLLVGPPALAKKLTGVRHERFVALGDGQRISESDYRITAFAVEHSGYENAYLVERGESSLLCAGDARYSPVFRRIAAQCKPLVSLLPVGGTEILGRRIVMDPADAWQAATDLGTKVTVPIHPGGEWLSGPPLSRHPGRAARLAELARECGSTFAVGVLAPGERGAADLAGRWHPLDRERTELDAGK